MVTGWPKPKVAPRSRDTISTTTVATRVSAPAMSTGLGSPGLVGRTTRMVASRPTAVIGVYTAKIARQPRASTSAPPVTRPIAGPPTAANWNQPIARARWFTGNAAMRMAIPLGIIMAPPRPTRARKAMKVSGFQASPHTPVAAVNTVNPMTSIRR